MITCFPKPMKSSIASVSQRAQTFSRACDISVTRRHCTSVNRRVIVDVVKYDVELSRRLKTSVELISEMDGNRYQGIIRNAYSSVLRDK